MPRTRSEAVNPNICHADIFPQTLVRRIRASSMQSEDVVAGLCNAVCRYLKCVVMMRMQGEEQRS
jgi:hypothetical protein